MWVLWWGDAEDCDRQGVDRLRGPSFYFTEAFAKISVELSLVRLEERFMGSGIGLRLSAEGPGCIWVAAEFPPSGQRQALVRNPRRQHVIPDSAKDWSVIRAVFEVLESALVPGHHRFQVGMVLVF